ncbi:MAG: geranylgeranyl diphosphate synthase CrtE [Cyanobacteria bacterium P01_A01_bin.37]
MTRSSNLGTIMTDERPNPASKFDLSAYLTERKAVVEDALNQSLQVVYPETIYESMKYSLMAGGKRLRPILCLATCEMTGGTLEMAMPTACALEMIHTMSLVHDDLPAMDNDDYRRGKLTNHKIYGDAIAILAGDGLLAYAFEFAATQTQHVPADRLVNVIARLGRAVGAAGLVGGQSVDLACEGKTDVSVETLDFIHRHKTAALLEASVVCGAVLTGASADFIQRLTQYAQAIGLAFQIVDDILDITATCEELGKTAGKDLDAHKVTYPSLWGLDKSRQKAQELVDSAKEELSPFGDAALPLKALADYITARTH